MKRELLPERLIFLTVTGSRAYGTDRPDSDWDMKGIAIAPLETYFGTQKWEQFKGFTNFEEDLLRKKQQEDIPSELIDGEVFNLQKLMRLAADGNPNILEIVFSPPSLWVHHHECWEEIYNIRHQFLSMKIRHSYTGYAMSQLKRIKSHRHWLLNPPGDKPTRSQFGLPEERSLVPKDIQDLAQHLIVKKQQEWQLDQFMEYLPEEFRDDVRDHWKTYFEMTHGRPFNRQGDHEVEQAAIQLGMSQDLFVRLEAERKYRSAHQSWKQYQEWKKKRNPARAKMEAEFGYDLKHSCHLVRLLLNAEEILSTGDLSVQPSQVEMLKEVLSGSWTYEELTDWAEVQKMKIDALAKSKPLPHSPDREALNNLTMELILKFNGR